jgi:hypothetical protein
VIARAFAGHAESGSDMTITNYVKADISEVAEALAALTGGAPSLGVLRQRREQARCHRNSAGGRYWGGQPSVRVVGLAPAQVGWLA